MDNIIEVQFNEMLQRTRSIWQYDYGQVLKILSGGVVLPNFLEVHFSLSRNNKECITRIGTTVNGVTEVQIPNELLNTENKTHDYFIYAFIYVSTEKYGNTKCEIIIPVKSRIKPENPSEEPLPEPNIFHETVEAVNAAADRAKMAEQSAKASATEAGKYAASASESAVTAEKTKEDALRKVGEKKQEAIEAIQNQEETSVGKITTHTDDEIQRIQNQTADSKAGLEQTITNADASKKELEHSIETAGTSKTALDKSVELAGTAKTELDTSIREAGTVKTALDESTETAGTVQKTLSATVKQAGALDTSLGEEIETGTQLKTDLIASGEKAVQDIQTAGSEQLGKMQAVAEEFTADREQIANNKEDIGSLQEELGDIESKFEIETEAFSNKCSIIRNNTPNNFTGNQITGVKQYFDFGENAALTKIKMNIKASNDDTVVLEIATLDGNIIATAEKAVTTEYTDVVFDLENIVIKEPVSVFVYTKGTNLLSYGLYATPYDDQSFSYIFPDGTRKSAFKIGTSEIPKPTTSNNKQCLVLFFDYTSKIIKNISDSISQNIDTTLLKSGKAADAKVVGDKLSKLEEDLSNKITKFYASNQGETHLADSDNGKIMDMMLYGRSEQKQYSGKNLAHGKNENYYINNDTSLCRFNNNDIGMAIDVSNLTSVTISTRSIQDRYRIGCVDTVPTKENVVTCYNGKRKDGTKDSYTIDTTDYNYLIVNATKLEDIQVEKGSEATSYEPYVGGQPSPSPDYSQEIKRVVNPVVKVCGKNLLQPNLRYNDRAKINIKKGTKLTLICKNGVVSKGGNLKFETANGGIAWFGFDKGNVKQQVTLYDDVVAFYYLFNSEPSESYALYIGDENTYEPYKEQSVQLPYTLNAIPVASGGNVTIGGQQYIADRVVEKDGVFGIERNIREIHTNTKTMNNSEEYPGWKKVEGVSDVVYYNVDPVGDSRRLTFISNFTQTSFLQNNKGTNNILYFIKNIIGYSQSELIAKAIDVDMYIRLQDAIFEPLPGDIQAKLRTLVTNYPVTNISVTSDQLDGYTVFNYPISMKNGWDYVKKQLNDNRDYIYDMDAKTQDIDTQSAEAYVNSEYAVALTELEVM